LLIFVSLWHKTRAEPDHQVLQNEESDVETLYRAAVALGNLVRVGPTMTEAVTDFKLVSPATSGSLQVGSVDTARALVIERAGSQSEKRLKDVAEEIGGL
jgi:phospholipase A-2-activating protein